MLRADPKVSLNHPLVAVMGGMYKGLHKWHYKHVTCAYWEFLIHCSVIAIPTPYHEWGSHVRPLISKGRIDLLLLNLVWLKTTL